MKKRIMCTLLCVMLLASGCSGKENSSNKENEINSTEAISSKSEISSETIKQTEAPAPIKVLPYAMEGYISAVEIPSNFKLESESDVSGIMKFKSSDNENDMITLNMLDAMDEENFGKFDEYRMSLFAENTLKKYETVSFKEIEIFNIADDIESESYIGVYTGEYEGKEATLSMLAVICPEKEQMAMLSVLDSTGNLSEYTDSLEKYLHICNTGFIVENNKLKEAPEPEGINFKNEEADYSIELSSEWVQVTDEEEKKELSNSISSYNTCDIFKSNERDVLLIGTTDGTSDDIFYASIDQQKKWFEVGGNKLISSKKCTVEDYAAYQIVLTRSIGPITLKTTAWFINRTGENPTLFSYALYDMSGNKDEFASCMIDNIDL